MKRLALLTAVLMTLTGLLAGCSSRGAEEASSQQESASQASAPSEDSYTTIDYSSNVNLVQFSSVAAGEDIVVLETTHGTIKIRVFPEKAPKAVENFLGLTEQAYYNGKTFHYASKNFMIQGGSLDGKGNGGTSIFNGEPFEKEWNADLWHFRGAVSMANTGAPNTTLSQFMIIQNSEVTEKTVEDMRAAQVFPQKVIEKYMEVGGSPHLDSQYTVFGQVIEGMEVVDAIAALQGEGNVPTEDVVILTATRTTY